MNISGIENATGLSAGDAEILSELVRIHNRMYVRNMLLASYYDGEHQPASIGVNNIPDEVGPDVKCDWARKAVTSVSERVRMDGFVFGDDYTDEALTRVVRANHIVDEFNRHVAGELTYGCMFATVQRNNQTTSVRMHSAETSSAIWDTATGHIGAGFVLTDVRRYSWTQTPVPAQINMHLPGRVIILRRTGPASWNAEKMQTPMDRPMMEVFAFRATGTKPLGETRITPTVRYLVDEVERTLRYMSVSSAFYATPQRYMLGLTDSEYDELVDNKWKTIIGAMLLSTKDADGDVPSVGQFSANSPQPYIDAIQTYAKLFSGATGVPLNSLGIVQDNPSSAEAMESQREDICIAAEDCIEANRESMRNVALMAMAVENNVPLDGLTDEQLTVMPRFASPRTPSLASTADAMVKIAGVLDGFSQTREFLTGMGFETAEVESIRAQVRRQQMKNAAMAAATQDRQDNNGNSDAENA